MNNRGTKPANKCKVMGAGGKCRVNGFSSRDSTNKTNKPSIVTRTSRRYQCASRVLPTCRVHSAEPARSGSSIVDGERAQALLLDGRVYGVLQEVLSLIALAADGRIARILENGEGMVDFRFGADAFFHGTKNSTRHVVDEGVRLRGSRVRVSQADEAVIPDGHRDRLVLHVVDPSQKVQPRVFRRVESADEIFHYLVYGVVHEGLLNLLRLPQLQLPFSHLILVLFQRLLIIPSAFDFAQLNMDRPF